MADQAFAIGLPDERCDEISVAWVVSSDALPVGEAELTEWSATRLAKFKRPRRVSFVAPEDLPATPTGKVQKFELIKMAHAIINGMGDSKGIHDD